LKRITNADLRTSYEGWAKEQGYHPLGGRAFADKLKARGCAAYRKGQERGWTGIRRRTTLDDDGMTDRDGISETRLYARAQEKSLGTGVTFRHSVTEELPGWVTETPA